MRSIGVPSWGSSLCLRVHFFNMVGQLMLKPFDANAALAGDRLRSAFTANGNLLRGTAMAIVQLSLPTLLFFYVFLPYCIGLHEIDTRLQVLFVFLSAESIMLSGLVARLLLLPEHERDRKPPQNRLLAANAVLLRSLPLGSKNRREQEIRDMYDLYPAETYLGSKRNLAFGCILSSVIVICMATFLWALPRIFDERWKRQTLLLSALVVIGVFIVDVVLVVALRQLRMYYLHASDLTGKPIYSSESFDKSIP